MTQPTPSHVGGTAPRATGWLRPVQLCLATAVRGPDGRIWPHPGAFVWADSTDADFVSETSNEFAVRATGGAFVTGNTTSADLPVTLLAFDSSFNLPSPPAQPRVDVATDHGKVILSWDAASRENYNEPGYLVASNGLIHDEMVEVLNRPSV